MVIPTKLYLTTFTSDLWQPNSAQGSQNWPFLMSNSCSCSYRKFLNGLWYFTPCSTYPHSTWQATLYTGSALIQDTFRLTASQNWIVEIKLMMTAKIIMHWRARLPNLPLWRWVLCTWVYPTSQIDYRTNIVMKTPWIQIMKIMCLPT